MGESLSARGTGELDGSGTSLEKDSDSRRDANIDFIGECGDVTNDLSGETSNSRKDRQLRALRGDSGVLGDSQPDVLIVLVGDRGGVMKPELNGEASSSDSFISGSENSKQRKQSASWVLVHLRDDRLQLDGELSDGRNPGAVLLATRVVVSCWVSTSNDSYEMDRSKSRMFGCSRRPS